MLFIQRIAFVRLHVHSSVSCVGLLLLLKIQTPVTCCWVWLITGSTLWFHWWQLMDRQLMVLCA